jgi:hypothetical protein
MEHIIAKIMKMKREDRVALAHGLLMELEKAEDITCWNFWERQTVKEIALENINGKISEAELTGLMGRLNKEWDSLAQHDWEKFSDNLNKHLKQMRIK